MDRVAQQMRQQGTMPTHDNSTDEVSLPESTGLSPTSTTGLGDPQSEGLHSDVNDPNAAAMNENADAAKMRQLTGEPPGSASAQNPSGLPPTQSPEFREGT